MKTTTNNVRVGLIHIGKREKSGLQIAEKLTQYQFKVQQWDVLQVDDTLDGLDKVDVIVVNIGIASFEFDELLAGVFEKDIKVIINEAILTNQLSGLKRQSWERHLLNKIDSSFSILPNKENMLNEGLLDLKKYGIKQVWALAASIGGPEAIQKFLSEFTGDEKILFIIIQHIDKEFMEVMSKQFNLASKLKVIIPVSGMDIEASACYIYPTDEHIYFNQNGNIELVAMDEKYNFSPCIDESIRRLNTNIENLNMAIFSGMSSDGIQAAQLVKESGNQVITQTESSCVLSTIIAGIKRTVEIEYDGTPSEMAKYIIQNNMKEVN